MSIFKKAQKSASKLKILLQGASGSGKTWSSLVLAKSLGKKIAVIDTEKGSASLYADKFDFDVAEMSSPYEPEKFILAINEAEKAGYDVIILDSISHEWQACLDLVTQIAKDKFSNNSYMAWSKVTPRHDKFVNAILQSNCHIIATTRAKTEYVTTSSDGKKIAPTKIGMAGIQRDGLDYEFTVVFELTQSHLANATKDRTSLFDGKDFIITEETGKELLKWLTIDPTPKENQPKIEINYDPNYVN